MRPLGASHLNPFSEAVVGWVTQTLTLALQRRSIAHSGLLEGVRPNAPEQDRHPGLSRVTLYGHHGIPVGDRSTLERSLGPPPRLGTAG